MLYITNTYTKCGICAVIFLIIAIYFQRYGSYYKNLSTIKDEYDYIVVGAGTAGCVLASRLSEMDGVNVLLIEAGSEFGYFSKLPITPTLLQRGQNDWSFITVPQKYSSYGLINQTQFIPRGRGLGGSGQMNYFLHGLGLKRDFESWFQDWKHSSINKLADDIFTYNNCTIEDSNSKCPRDGSGKTDFLRKQTHKVRLTSVDSSFSDITNVFIRAIKELKHRSRAYAAPFYHTINEGVRESTFNNYILPHLSKINLHVLPNSLVSKIIFKEKTVHGVEVISDNLKKVVLAKKEIVLSCGSVKTPQLLMLSGLGPKDELKKHKIEVVSDLQGVGKNLHDHLNVPLYVEIEKPLSMTLKKVLSLKEILKYIMTGTGYISSPGVVAYAYGSKNDSVMLFAMGSTDEELLREIANFRSDVFRSFFPYYKNISQEGIVLLANCLQPKSRGTIKLASPDPNELPLIDPNYLSDQYDVKCFASAIRLVDKIVNTPAFKSIGALIKWPDIKECTKFFSNIIKDDYLECIIRFGALTGHHVAGTCSMGGKSPVVDNELRVYGVSGLRIVDASIFPSPISTAPNSVLIVIAERAATLIANDHENNESSYLK